MIAAGDALMLIKPEPVRGETITLLSRFNITVGDLIYVGENGAIENCRAAMQRHLDLCKAIAPKDVTSFAC